MPFWRQRRENETDQAAHGLHIVEQKAVQHMVMVCVLLVPTLAVLKVKMKIKIKFPSGFGPESAQNHRCPEDDDSPGPPPAPPGDGGQEQIKKLP